MKTCRMHGPCAVAVFGAAALVLALDGGAAQAHGVVTAPLADYNSAQVSLAGGNLTVPFGGILASPVYTVSAGTQLELGSLFTITLPSGFLFQSAPVIAASNAATLSFHSGGISSNSITYSIGNAAVTAGNTLSVGGFTVSGATALESQFGGNTLPMTFQATANASSSNNDTAPVSVPVFTHAVGSLPDTITPGSGQINLGVNPPGTKFVPSGATVAGSGLVATFAINTELNDPFNSNAPVLKANGLANSLNPSDTANIQVDGNFIGIASAYASPTVTTCQTSIPGGAIAGTVASGSLSFNSVPINTPVQICMIPDGSTLMQPMNQPYVYTYTAGSGSTDFFGGLSQTTAGNYYTYNGSVIQEILYTGVFSTYSGMYARIVNDGLGTVEIIAEVKSDNGGNLGFTSISVPGNTNQLILMSQIIKSSGFNVSNGRFSMIFVTATPGANVKIAQLMINPTGDLVQLGSGGSP